MTKGICLYLQHFLSSLSLRRCGRSANKLFSVALAIVLMFSFAFPTYAASDGTEDIIASDMDLDVYYASNDSDVETHITDKCNVSIWNSNDSYPEYKGFTCIRVPYQAMIGSDGHIVFLTEDLDESCIKAKDDNNIYYLEEVQHGYY